MRSRRLHETTAEWVKTSLLFGTGIYLVANVLTGNITNYVSARFVWLSWLAASLFLLIGGFSLQRLLSSASSESAAHEHGPHCDHDVHGHGAECGCGHDHHGAHGEHEAHHEHTAECGCGHAHGAVSWRSLAVIAIPLVLAVSVPSSPLGASAIDGSVSVSAAGIDGAKKEPTSGTSRSAQATPASTVATQDVGTKDAAKQSEPSVLDWLREFNESTDRSAFAGQPADVVGFVYVDPRLGEHHFMASRFVVSCCVADASVVGLPVEWEGEVVQDEWVRVTGTMQVGELDGEPAPVLRATSVEGVEQPDQPYLYP